MTESLIARLWREFWHPSPPKCVQIAADAQAEAASRLVRRIERDVARRRSVSVQIDRDLTGHREGGHGHAD